MKSAQAPESPGIHTAKGDPRQIEFRVHVQDERPSEIEIFVRLRKADHSAGTPKSVRFPWPPA